MITVKILYNGSLRHLKSPFLAYNNVLSLKKPFKQQLLSVKDIVGSFLEVCYMEI